jgi:hypothetical protein
MNKVKIYTLEHPITGEIRYIGQTIQELNVRLSQHCAIYRKNNHGSHKKHWVKSLLDDGLKPIIRVLDECNLDDYYDTEQYWIEQFKNWGFRLVNATDGGPGTKGRVVQEHEKTTIPLLCWDENGDFVNLFKSARVAAKELSISYKHISTVAKNKRASVSGYRFKYFNGGTIIEEKITPYRKVTNKGKIVQQFNLGGQLIKVWGSCNEAAIELGINLSNINAVCNPNMREKTYKGFIWSYKD